MKTGQDRTKKKDPLEEKKKFLNRIRTLRRRLAELEPLRGEHRRAKEELELFRFLINQTNDAIFVTEPETGRILDINDRAAEGLGYTRGELLEMKVTDVEEIFNQDASRWMEHVAEVRQKGHMLLEGRHRRKDGSVMPVEINTRHVVRGEKEYLVAVVRDIQWRKQMESELIQARQDWEDVFNTITDMITIHDADFNIVRANKSAEKVLGLELLNITRAKCYEYYHGAGCPPEGCPSCVVLKTGKPAHFEIFEPHLNIFMEIRAIPRFDETGKNLVGLIHVVRDITGRKQAETELERYRIHLEELVRERTLELEAANSKLLEGIEELQRTEEERRRAEAQLRLYSEELAKSNRELEQFASVASHDLQEPLITMASSLKLFRRHYSETLGPDAGRLISDAYEEAERAQKLIRSLLAYSRVGRRIKVEKVDFSSALGITLGNLRHLIQESGAEIEVGGLPETMADPVLITQLFQNLITNAIKFRGRERPRIRIQAEKNMEDRQWLFSVRDNGIGIEPEGRERIFEIFQRMPGKKPGTGIGLATCKKIVELHGGSIWVESEPGKGSVFYFTIPLGG